MPKDKPEIRFAGYTDAWEKRKLSSQYKKITEKNDLSFKTNKIISVANMYYKSDSAKSDDNYMKTYNVFRIGDIAFEGHKSNSYAYGRFVENTIGDGIVSHIFDVFRPIRDYDLQYWKYAIQYEPIMGRLLMKSTTKSTMMNNLVAKDFLKKELRIPKLNEQQKIGGLFQKLDKLITVNQRKVDLLKELKKGFLQKMFPKNGEDKPEIRFGGYTDAWEKRKLGDNIIQYNEHTIENNQYPVFTSSRKGLFFQKDYYDGHQIASVDNTGYNIVPKGYFTYRHMSDDLIFKFNINDLADYGIVSTLYPVFTTTENLDAMYLMYQLNEGTEFKRFSLLQKQGGSRTYMYFSKLKELKLTIPNIKEQKSISELFKQLDSLITVNQRRVDLLKQEKKALLQKMFV